jgi:hypothetical protein
VEEPAVRSGYAPVTNYSNDPENEFQFQYQGYAVRAKGVNAASHERA